MQFQRGWIFVVVDADGKARVVRFAVVIGLIQIAFTFEFLAANAVCFVPIEFRRGGPRPEQTLWPLGGLSGTIPLCCK